MDSPGRIVRICEVHETGVRPHGIEDSIEVNVVVLSRRYQDDLSTPAGCIVLQEGEGTIGDDQVPAPSKECLRTHMQKLRDSAARDYVECVYAVETCNRLRKLGIEEIRVAVDSGEKLGVW